MNSNKQTLKAIPTNIISGFLGAGKTSAIVSLLKTKPRTERWAVLVNEFGEIGIDGALLKGQQGPNSGVFIREVPGGCMCCTAGVPMQVALNQLLKQAKPDRLLIEPTGLGHPKEVLQTLSSSYYKNVLSLQKTITLVDARKLNDSRYTSHATFNQQIDIADIIVGNKHDLYTQSDAKTLTDYVIGRANQTQQIVFTTQGEFSPALLQGASAYSHSPSCAAHTHNKPSINASEEAPLPASGIVCIKNSAQGYQSIGWRISAAHIFSKKALHAWLCNLKAERIKAVIKTDEGIVGFNFAEQTLTVTPLSDCQESRIEIIAIQINSMWPQQLINCLINNKTNSEKTNHEHI